MEIPLDKQPDGSPYGHWYDRIWASLIFFTRLPFWRLYQPPKGSYRTVVEHWPLTGWLTGGLTAAALYGMSLIMPFQLAVILAMTFRLLLTGALHEDGLADFLDGFGGGGKDRQRILMIMKDSHIGTFGVLGLIIYALTLWTALMNMEPLMAALCIVAADPFSKMVTAQMVQMMPYARKEEESKARTVYRKMDWKAGVSLSVQGLLPMVAFLWLSQLPWEFVIFLPCLLMYFLYLLIWHRLHGYTGDCCGAVCLLVELAVYVVVCALVYVNPEFFVASGFRI